MKIQPANLNFYTYNNKNKRSDGYVSVPKTLQQDTVEFKNTNSVTFKGKSDDEKFFSEGAKKVIEVVKYMTSQSEFNLKDENEFFYSWADFLEIENPDIQNMYHGSKDTPACNELVQLIKSYSNTDDAHSSPINEDFNQAKFIRALLDSLLRRGLIINDEEYSKLILGSASQKQYKMLSDLIYYCKMQDKSCQKTTLSLLQDLRFSFPGDEELGKSINYFEGKCEEINRSPAVKIPEDSEGVKKVKEIINILTENIEYTREDDNKFIIALSDLEEMNNPEIQNMYHGSDDTPACKELVDLIKSYSGRDENGKFASALQENSDKGSAVRTLLDSLLRKGLIINDDEYSRLMINSTSQTQCKMLDVLIEHSKIQDKDIQNKINLAMQNKAGEHINRSREEHYPPTEGRVIYNGRVIYGGMPRSDNVISRPQNMQVNPSVVHLKESRIKFTHKCEELNNENTKNSYAGNIYEDSEGVKKVKEIIKLFSEIEDYTTEDKNKLITALTDFEEMDNPEIQDMYHGSDKTPACEELVDLIKSYSGTDNGSLPLDEDEPSDDNNKADFIRALLFDLLQYGLKIDDASYIELMENALEKNQPKMLELLIEKFEVTDVRLQKGIIEKIGVKAIFYNTSFQECGDKISKKCRELNKNGSNTKNRLQTDKKIDKQEQISETKNTKKYEEISSEIFEKYDIYDIKNWSKILDEISETDDKKSSNTIRFVVENLSDIFYSDENKNDYKKIIERLQTINGDWNIIDKTLGSSLAHKSLMAENPLLIQLAYDKKVDFLQKDISGKMPLDLMNEFDGSEEVKEVFKNMKINYPLVIELASKGVAAGLKMLLKKPYIDINSVDENGNNAGIAAAENNMVNVIKLLNSIDSFDINYVNPENGKSALSSVKNPETLTAILDNPKIELYDENKIPLAFKFIAEAKTPLDTRNIRELFKALLSHPKIDITEKYNEKTIADILKNYASDSTKNIKREHKFFNELSEILNEAVSCKMHEKTKKIVNKNGMLSLKEISDFIESPNVNSIINLPLNNVNEPIGFFVADIPADFNNISEILKIMTTLTEKEYNYSLKNTMGQTMLDKAKDADNELLVDYITQIMQVEK